MNRLTIFQFKALLYADIFEYPLTKQELVKYEVRSKKYEVDWQKRKSHINYFCYLGGFYCLKGREQLVQLRIERERFSKSKMAIAHKAAGLLRAVPTIQMIAITGALAMNNARDDDDIDFLIVASKNRIWLSRLWSVILWESAGLRRRPNDTDWNNKICLNMFVDKEHLSLPKIERDLFSAHEAAQMKVLWSRGDIEKKWWRENEWIKRYLPNFQFSIFNFQSNSNFSDARSVRRYNRTPYRSIGESDRKRRTNDKTSSKFKTQIT